MSSIDAGTRGGSVSTRKFAVMFGQGSLIDAQVLQLYVFAAAFQAVINVPESSLDLAQSSNVLWSTNPRMLGSSTQPRLPKEQFFKDVIVPI